MAKGAVTNVTWFPHFSQYLSGAAEDVSKEGQREITTAMRAIRQELARVTFLLNRHLISPSHRMFPVGIVSHCCSSQVEEQMRADLARVTAQNEAILAPQINLCDSVLADLDEGVYLAKGYLESEDPNSKPLAVVQSIEVGINEIVETSIPVKITLQKAGRIDTGAVMARLAALKLPTEDISVSDGLNMTPRKPAKAYERLHNLSVRKRVEDVNLKPIDGTPFSSFPASPPHTMGVGHRIN